MSEQAKSEAQQDSSDHPPLASFLKYCSDDERVIKGIFEDHTIRFTPPKDLNDPLEANPILRFPDCTSYQWFRYKGVTLPSDEWWFRLHRIQRRINKYGVLSLTKVWDSFDMWSRYANGHKGFLLWLKSDFNECPYMLSPDGRVYPVKEVEYPFEHVIDIGSLFHGRKRLQPEVIYEKVFFQKASRWQAEHEYRMVRPLSDLTANQTSERELGQNVPSGLFDFSLDCVVGITFGACMSIDKRSRIKNLCDGFGIPCSQACIIRDEREEDALGGKMGKVKIVPPDLSLGLMDVDQCILDSAHINDQESKLEITSLQDLPYWNDDPAWVQELYENRKKRLRMES